MLDKLNGNSQYDDEEYNEEFLRNFEYKENGVFICDNCDAEISQEEYERNEGICNECIHNMY